MRVTQEIMMNVAIASEDTAASRVAQLTQQASSGLAVTQPSDDPAAYASIQEQNADIGVVTARASAAKVAAGDLNLAETTLDSAGNLIAQAQSIAVEASNGTEDAASRSDAAQQVGAIFTQMLALANTKGQSGYLFGGTANSAPPFDSAGNFQGNSDVTQVQIADGVSAVSNASGADAFTATGGTDVFAAIQNLQTALAGNNVAGISGSISTLQAANTQMISARVAAGTDAGRLTSAATTMATALTQMQASLANVQDADVPSVLTNLQASQTAYEAAIDVNKQVLSTAMASLGGG